MRIAVTGGNGDLARVLIPMLVAKGHEVKSLDRTLPARTSDNPLPAHALVVDTTDYGQVVAALSGCDGVIHLAAHRSPKQAPDHVVYHDNTVSSYHVLFATETRGIRKVCMASSINAIGGVFSEAPRYDYLPLDERHPCYAEDPYSQSKWVLELQGDAFARRRSDVAISSLRFHGITSRENAMTYWANNPAGVKHLWGYVDPSAAARACIAAMNVSWYGHNVFYIVAPDVASDVASETLAATHYPESVCAPQLTGTAGFFDCSKAANLLGWHHNED